MYCVLFCMVIIFNNKKYILWSIAKYYNLFMTFSSLSQSIWHIRCQVCDPMRSWSQRHCLLEKLLLPIVGFRDVCFILPQIALKQWALVHKKNSTKKHQRDNSLPCLVLMISRNSSNKLFLFILSHQELSYINLPFIAIKGDTSLLFHIWIIHLPQWRCLFQNLWWLIYC